MAITRCWEAYDPMCSSSLTKLLLCGHRSERTDNRRADLHSLRVGKFFKNCFESRIRFTNTFGVLNDRLSFSKQARYSKGHGNAMIAKALQTRSVQRRWSINFKSIA